MTEPMPSDRTRAARIAFAVLAGALGTALVGGGLWLAFRPKPPPTMQTEIEPAEETAPSTSTPGASATASPPASADATSAGTDGDGGASVDGTSGAAVARGRAPRIAFRLGASIYVAEEDGSGARVAVRSASGPYALSPDAKMLAVVDGRALQLVEVDTGKVTRAASADPNTAPVWMPDSSAVIAARPGAGGAPELFKVGRSGSGAATLAIGDQAGVSPDGEVIVVKDPSRQDAVLVSVGDSAFRQMKVRAGMPTAVAASDRLVFVGASGPGGPAIVAIKTDGSGERQLMGAPPGGIPALWGRVCVSPDGLSLAVAAQGDDGFSRSFILPSGGGQPRAVSERRDSYLRGWSATGDRLFLIEGNAFQGEGTALVSVGQSGAGRRLLVTGAQ